MAGDAPPIDELLRARLDLTHRISALNARKLALQQRGFGAEIALLDRQRAGPSGGSAEEQAGWAEAQRLRDDGQAEIAALDAEIDALEAGIEAIDRRIAEVRNCA